ncbi:AMP-binding protein [Leekyejoonella antrihumi]|uniref:AMP-binding protein n=1 Tax=Leekyejoonella antrihumi TaxID=1660198 RepID=A0A563E217_9MICO|nr:AMP-binding protein [Leekyejoonella antrihumi]TWP36329.1 AMP-binding protein [Leekyejoonella antrihumi]
MGSSTVVPLLKNVDQRRRDLDARHRPWPQITLSELLDRVAAEHPERPFVIDDQNTCTYAEMQEWSRRLARGLVGRGIESGDHVAMVLPNSVETVAVRFAIARTGAVAVPINFQLRAEELAYVLTQSRASAVITMEEFRGIDALDALDRITPGWERGQRGGSLPELRLVVTVPHASARPARSTALTLGCIERDPDPAIDDELAARAARMDPRDTTTIFYTSGTTGQAKGVLSSHDMELRSAYGSAYTRAFEDGRRILFALPLHHVFAYIEGLLASMFVGGCAVLQPAFDPRESLLAIERHDVGEALFVPMMSLAIIDAVRAGSYDLSSLHSVMSAAQSAPARVWKELSELLDLEQLVTAYGMTETSAATTFTMPGDTLDNLVDTVGRPKLGGSAGDPELGGRLAEYKAVDLSGRDLQPGEEGELAARGPIVAPGYYGKAQETAEVMLPGGWLRSGDLGRVRVDGYLELTGRSKDLYKRGAEMVMPAEIEARLDRRPDVAQAHVVGVPDERMGEVGCAWVVPNEDAKPTAEELIDYCRSELARFKVPVYVLFTTADQLPLTASGKVQKFKLAERAARQLGL